MKTPLSVAVAQLDCVVGDISGNARRILDAVARAKAAGADVLLTPELALCGYPPEDLLLRPAFLDACAEELDALAARIALRPFDFVAQEMVNISQAPVLAVDGEAPGGIDDQHVKVVAFGVVDGSTGDVDRQLADAGREPFDFYLACQQFQLLDGGGAVNVGGDEQDFFLALFFQQLGQLACGGGLARALQTSHQHDGRWHGSEVERVVLLTHQLDQLFVHHTDHGLARSQAAHDLLAHGAFTHLVDEGFDDRQGNVGFQQGDGQGVAQYQRGGSRGSGCQVQGAGFLADACVQINFGRFGQG